MHNGLSAKAKRLLTKVQATTHSSSSRSDLGTQIKPIAPKEYHGQADVRAYHRFVNESEVYLHDGKVKGRHHIFLLSYYLTGWSYDFYTQKVSLNEEEWTLHQFYDELFNFCFPVDYMIVTWHFHHASLPSFAILTNPNHSRFRPLTPDLDLNICGLRRIFC